MNKTNNTVTAENITAAQIKALRAEASERGDMEQVEICDLALSRSPIRTLSVIGAEGVVEDVEEDTRQICADAINAARAMEV